MVKDLRPRKPRTSNGAQPESNQRAKEQRLFGALRGALLLSVLAHGALFVALVSLASYFSSTRLPFTPTYTVNLVDLPSGRDPGGRTPAPERRQAQAKKPEPPPEPPRAEKPPEPKAEKPTPPSKPKPEAPKAEMTLPTAKAKEPPKREEKKPEPAARQTPEKAKEVKPQGRPTPEPAASAKREGERPGTGSALALGTGGGMLSLDTANFPFTYYLRQVTDRIEQNWVRPQENLGRVVVYFRIKRDGAIVEPQVYESSRNGAVDLLAAGAVKRSEPFPPLPEEFGGDYLGIYLCFGVGALCPGQREG